jgi:hypothetical protein
LHHQRPDAQTARASRAGFEFGNDRTIIVTIVGTCCARPGFRTTIMQGTKKI